MAMFSRIYDLLVPPDQHRRRNVKKVIQVCLSAAAGVVVTGRHSPCVRSRDVQEDWLKDSQGESYLTKEQFYNALFELSDIWVATISAHASCLFLSIIEHKLRDVRVWKPSGTGVRSRRGSQASPLPPRGVSFGTDRQARGASRACVCVWLVYAPPRVPS